MASRSYCPDGKKGKKGGDTSCGVGGEDSEKRKEKGGRRYKGGYVKTVEYTEKKQKPMQTKVDVPHKTVETESGKKGDTKVYEGKTSEYKGNVKSGFKPGEKKETTMEGGNKGEGRVSKEKHTKYFKERGRIGKFLTGTKYKQVGGKIESQTSEGGKEGKTETLVYKRNPSKYRKGYESNKVTESIGEQHKKQKAEEASQLIKGKSEPTRFEKVKVSGTDTDYKLGDLEKKKIPTSKKGFKKEVKKEYKKYGKANRKKALGKMSAKYSKYGKG